MPHGNAHVTGRPLPVLETLLHRARYARLPRTLGAREERADYPGPSAPRLEACWHRMAALTAASSPYRFM